MSIPSPVVVVLLSVAITVDVVCLVIAGLKRRLGLVVVGAVLSTTFGYYGLYAIAPFAPVVGAARLARPRSYWARRFYDADKMTESVRRFG